MVSTSVAAGFFFANRYTCKGHAIEYRWARLLVACVIPAVAFIPYVAGAISQDLALHIMAALYVGLAWAFLIAMMAVFVSARCKGPSHAENGKVGARREALVAHLGR